MFQTHSAVSPLQLDAFQTQSGTDQRGLINEAAVLAPTADASPEQEDAPHAQFAART